MSRLPGWLIAGLSVLVVAGPVLAQQPDPALALADLQAEQDPAAAWEALGHLLARADLPPRVALAGARERPRLLLRLGRRPEAEQAWQELLRRGQPVANELLALSSSELFAEAPRAHPGQAPTLNLRGKATGPLELRLYRVAAARWRATVEADPSRPLAHHLRAPPPASLQRLRVWTHAGLPREGGEATLELPDVLPTGQYLVTATAKGVAVSAPLLVSRARAAVRRRTGPGLLVLVDEVRGQPLAAPQVWTCDAEGFGWSRLTPRSADPPGFVWSRPDPAQAWVWDEETGPLLLELPGERPPRSPPHALWTDLPHYRPGQAVFVRVLTTPRRPAVLRVRDPEGWVVLRREVRTDRAGLAQARVQLPPQATPGTWTVELADARVDVRVELPPTEAFDLRLTAPRATSSPELELAATALLASGAPLGGRLVRWRLQSVAATPGRGAELGPLPPHALRPQPGAEWEQVSAGELTLDAAGEVAWRVSLPAGGPRLLLLEAELGLGQARAQATRWIAQAPAGVVLGVHPVQVNVSAGELLTVELLVAGLDGQPVSARDLTLEARDAEGAVLARQELRSNERGRATAFLRLDTTGPVQLEVRAQDADGRPAQAGSEAFVIKGSPGDTARLVLARAPTPERPGEVAVWLPFAHGKALLTCEGDTVESSLVEVVDGLARWELPALNPPGGRVLLDAFRDGQHHQAELTIALEPPPLELDARIADYGDDRLRVRLRTLTHDARDRPAAVTAVVYPEATARWLARGVELGPPTPLSAEGGQPASWTNGRGIGALALGLPQRAGRYWIRLDAVDATGSRGLAWLPLEIGSRLAMELSGPQHLVAGDHGELTARLVCREGIGALPDAVMRLTWSATGVELGRPKLLGTKALLGQDPGPNTLLLAPAEEVWVSLPLIARSAGPARITCSLDLQGSTAEPVEVRFELPVTPRGLREARRFSGAVEPGAQVEVPLDLPQGAAKRPVALELSVDPEPATAAVGALRDMLRPRPGLRGDLQALLARGPLAALLEVRRLAPPAEIGAGPDRAHVLARLSATWDAATGWGDGTDAVVLALQRLSAGGQPIPLALIDRALDLIAARAEPGATGTLALVRAGRVRALTPVDPEAHSPDELVTWLQAQALVGPDARTEALLGAVLERVDALRTTRARAELFLLLLAFDREPTLQTRLLEEVLDARRGAGWRDPDDAGAAFRALLAQARRDGERPGARFDSSVDGWDLHQSWSGDGLREWEGVATVADRLGGRSKLTLRVIDAPNALRYAGRVEGFVKAQPARSDGLLVRTAWLDADSSKPVGVAGVRPGDRLRVTVDLSASDGKGLAGTLLELPLPGGCLPLSIPADARLEGGMLQWEPRRGRLELELLATAVGDYRLLPARLRSLSDPARVGVGEERRLRISR